MRISHSVTLPPPAMPTLSRTLIARLAWCAGMALAAWGGVLLHSSFPATFGPVVSLTAPLLLLLSLALAITLLVYMLERERKAALSREQAYGADAKARNTRLKLLESAVVHARDGVVVLEPEPSEGLGRRVLYANDAFLLMTGYDRDEIEGRTLHHLRGPETDPKTLAELRQAMDAGLPLRVELRNHRKDGSAFWVDLSLVPVPDASGRVSHWVMVQRETSDRRAAEEAVRRSESLFRGIFEGTSAGVSLTDPSGRFVACNPAFAALLGRPVEDVLRLTPADVTHSDDNASQAPLIHEVNAGLRDRYSFTKRYVRPDGEIVWAELSFAAIRGVTGDLEYGLGVSLNVTEQRRLEEQLRQSQKLEAIGQMAGGIAHDFNNLLTAALGNLALVNLPGDDPNRSLLAAVEQASRRAAELTGMLVSYARRNQLQAGCIRPAKAFEEVASLLRRTFDPRIDIVIDVEPECGCVRADATLLSQALVNLCLNARDAMPEGGTLTLRAETAALSTLTRLKSLQELNGPFLRLTVSDTGTGMTAEVQRRVFEPFFTTKEPGKGTGLGLPMVLGIIRQHHGWLDYHTEAGRGTSFDLYLPAATATETPPSIVTPPPRINELDPLASSRTILLVDDEPMIRHLGKTVLERAGYQVLTAEDGNDAVDVFARECNRISLVILDAIMPRMSGTDAYRHMTAIDPEARVLFSSGYCSEDLAGMSGALGLLAKPYRPEGLLAAVRDALALASTAS